MNRPKTSILIPTYNRATLLRECLHFALTVPADSEVVIVDNASTDATPDVAAEHIRRDARVRYVRNETNIGMVGNFNKAMGEARGDYLCVVCDDDLILPGHCEKKTAILDRHPEIAYVYCPWHMIDAQGNSSGTPLGSGMLTYPYLGGRDEFGDLIQNNHIMMNGVLFRRSMFEELGGLDPDPDIHPSPDWEMWLRYSFDRQTAYLPEPTCAVRFHDTSHSVTTGTGQGAFAKARVNVWRRWLVEREPPIVLNENVWHRMRALWEQDLNYWFNQDQAQVQPYLAALEEIKRENQRCNERRFASALANDGKRGSDNGQKSEIRNPKSEIGIRWTGNLFDYSGYARLSRDTVLALDAAGVPVQIEPEGGSQRFVDAEIAPVPEELARWQRLRAAAVEPAVDVYFGVPTWWDGTDAFGRHRSAQETSDPTTQRPLYVGIAMFETDRLPNGWAGACNGMDEIWVPSEFNRETFVRSGVEADRLQVIPFGIEASAYDPDHVKPLPLPSAGFTFLSVFQWSRRKGWDVLLDAYFGAFVRQDDVQLVIRAYPDAPDARPIREEIDQFAARWASENSGRSVEDLPRLVILDEFIAESDMPRLYCAGDAFVLPTRGEGWGIPYMEAMASGLPVIATDWSAHREFMSDDTAYLIPINGLSEVDPEQTARNPFYGAGHRWAEPNVEATTRFLRHVFHNREEAHSKGAAARAHIQRKWTIERTAKWISGRVAEWQSSRVAESSVTREQSHPSTSPHRHSVSWSAPLFDPSGYAEEARHFLLALEDAGTPVVAQDIRWSNRLAVLSACEEQRLLSMTARSPRPGGVHVSHILAPHFTHRADAAVNIGRTMFETDRLPDGWAEACNQMDRIWVPSEFNRKSFEFAGVDAAKLAVVPGAIDHAPYDPSLPPLQIEGARGFNFLSVFDWSLRKGWDVLIRAFVEEFEAADDLALIIKTHSSLGYSTEQIVSQVDRYLREELGRDPDSIPDIIFQDGDLPAHQMPRLYLAADCFVLPTRGEGWGRPYMEAMALGLPTIGTAWSGNTAFMNDQNSYLIACDLVDVPEAAWRETPTFRGHRWAEPDTVDLRARMRQVFEDRDGAREVGAAARDDILTHYSYYQVAAIIQQEIERALDLPLRRAA